MLQRLRVLITLLVLALLLVGSGRSAVSQPTTGSQPTYEDLERLVNDRSTRSAQAQKLLEQKLADVKVIQDHIRKRERTIQVLEEDIKTGNLKSSRLGNVYATATGQRSSSYHAEPPIIRKLIDELEAKFLSNVRDAGSLFLGVANLGAQYDVEIRRSKRFLEILRREEKKLIADIEKLGGTAAWEHPEGTSIPLLGCWRLVGGGYEIEVVRTNGQLSGQIKESPEQGFGYVKGTNMFVRGSMQQDGTYRVQWTQYPDESQRHKLAPTTTPATIKLAVDSASLVITGKNRKYGYQYQGWQDKPTATRGEQWLDEFGSDFTYRFIRFTP